MDSLRANPYATIVAAGVARYVILTDRGTVSRIDTTVHRWADRVDTGGQWRSDELPEAARSVLRQIGYLIPTGQDPSRAVSATVAALEQRRAEARPAPSAHIFLTHGCNFRCTYCIQGQDIKDSGIGVLSTAQYDLIERFLSTLNGSELPASEPRELTIFGGEPLVPATRNIVEHILVKRQQSGKQLTFVTNGYYLDLFQELFDRYRSSVPYTFLISVDGPAEVHDRRRPLANGQPTFERVTENISHSLRNGARVVLQPIVDADNGGHLTRLLEYCEQRGWMANERFEVRIGVTMFPHQAATEGGILSHEDEAIPHLVGVDQVHGSKVSVGLDSLLKPSSFIHSALAGKKFVPAIGCSATLNQSFSFSPDGLVYPCREYAGRGLKHAIGRYDPAAEVFAESARRWFASPVSSHPKCSQCKFVLICGGGCRVATESRGRGLEDPLCPPFISTWDVYLKEVEGGRLDKAAKPPRPVHVHLRRRARADLSP